VDARGHRGLRHRKGDAKVRPRGTHDEIVSARRGGETLRIGRVEFEGVGLGSDLPRGALRQTEVSPRDANLGDDLAAGEELRRDASDPARPADREDSRGAPSRCIEREGEIA